MASLKIWLFTLQITRRNAFHKVWSAIAQAERAMPPGRLLKLNCVVERGQNDTEIVPMAELTRERALDVRFIEWMPFAGNRYDMAKFVPYRESLARLETYYGREQISRLTAADGPNPSSKVRQI